MSKCYFTFDPLVHEHSRYVFREIGRSMAWFVFTVFYGFFFNTILLIIFQLIPVQVPGRFSYRST